MNAIAILDAGGQYCHLIARRIRQLGVHTEVLPINVSAARLQTFAGVVISGGPRSVLAEGSPRIRPEILSAGIPVLGICYGHQLLAHTLDSTTVSSRTGSKEYGDATMRLHVRDTLFKGVAKTSQVWMSHGDAVHSIPKGFSVLASTDDCNVAAMGDLEKKLFGVQFHPEVAHTKYGQKVLRNFVESVCGCKATWEPDKAPAIDRLITSIRTQVQAHQRVLFFVSGGVDSSVAYRLCVEALGADRVHGVFVDTGLLRQGEAGEVERMFVESGFRNVETVCAEDDFLKAIGDAVDPEDKRRRIGAAFLDVENAKLRQFPRGEWLLGQGTIYPDTIESGGSRESALIKTHHNRVPELLQRISNGEVIEPLAEFYKDEVRRIGTRLGLPNALVNKQPFPGPGLAVRCLCADGPWVPPNDELLVRVAKDHGFSARALPIRAVGVQGDERTYAAVAVLEDHGPEPDWNAVARASRAITNVVPNINRVAYLVRSRTAVTSWAGHAAYLTKDRLERLRRADAAARKEIERDPAADLIWQCPIVQIPIGEAGTFKEVIVARPIESVDGMTAEFVGLRKSTLDRVADRVLSDQSIEALLCDVTNKPPATIEWE